MTIKELIEELQSYPEDMRVITYVKENTFDDATGTEEINIVTDKYDDVFTGRHEECRKGEEGEKALLILGE